MATSVYVHNRITTRALPANSAEDLRNESMVRRKMRRRKEKTQHSKCFVRTIIAVSTTNVCGFHCSRWAIQKRTKNVSSSNILTHFHNDNRDLARYVTSSNSLTNKKALFKRAVCEATHTQAAMKLFVLPLQTDHRRNRCRTIQLGVLRV